MNTVTYQPLSVKTVREVKAQSSREPLAPFEVRHVTIRDAIALVKLAEQVAFTATLNSSGQYVYVDVTKANALRTLRRIKGRVAYVRVEDTFRTLCIGM